MAARVKCRTGTTWTMMLLTPPAFGQHATTNRSQPYYPDVTNKDANKGAVVEYLSRHLGVPAHEIATIGDQPNDVLMFKRSGFSIAMGNASDQVKAQA